MEGKTLTKYHPALSAALLQVKASGGQLLGLEASNLNNVDVWIQFFDPYSTATTKLGSTLPVLSLFVPKASQANGVGRADKSWANPIVFNHKICVAATTAPHGCASPPKGLNINIFYT